MNKAKMSQNYGQCELMLRVLTISVKPFNACVTNDENWLKLLIANMSCMIKKLLKSL